MTKYLTALMIVSTVAPVAQANTIDTYVTIQSADRSVDTNAAGIVGSTPVFASDSDSSTTDLRFTTSATVYEYVALSRTEAVAMRSVVNHNGNLTEDTFGAELYTVSASYAVGAGNTGSTQSDNLYDVEFDLSQRVRFTSTYNFRTIQQGAGANAFSSIELTDGAGTVINDLVNAAAYASAASDSGWLEAGTANLTVEQVADANSLGGSIGANTSGSFLVRLYCPADIDMDGDVDTTDQSIFNAYYSNGDVAGDMDGDGDIDAADLNAYGISFASGC